MADTDPNRAPALDAAKIADRFLALWCVGWVVTYVIGGGMAWHFFVQGQQALTDLDDPVSGGLHLYAALPQLQIGPVALGVSWLFSPFGRSVSLILAQSFGTCAGVVILVVARSLAKQFRPDLSAGQIAWRTRLAAFFFTPVWLYLAVASTHLDDVLALFFGVLALYAATRQWAALAGLLVGLSVDSKPWALPFAVVLLLLSGSRARAIGLACLAVTIAAGWLPFLAYDPHTLNAMRFTIANTPRSALRVLEIDSPRTPPWDRPAQALLGALLGAAAMYRGRWSAVILIAVATRVVLDPGTNIYYSGGVVVGAALWDIIGSGSRIPWWTATAAIALLGGRHVGLPPSAIGWITLCYFLACLTLVFRTPARSTPDRRVQALADSRVEWPLDAVEPASR